MRKSCLTLHQKSIDNKFPIVRRLKIITILLPIESKINMPKCSPAKKLSFLPLGEVRATVFERWPCVGKSRRRTSRRSWWKRQWVTLTPSIVLLSRRWIKIQTLQPWMKRWCRASRSSRRIWMKRWCRASRSSCRIWMKRWCRASRSSRRIWMKRRCRAGRTSWRGRMKRWRRASRSSWCVWMKRRCRAGRSSWRRTWTSWPHIEPHLILSSTQTNSIGFRQAEDWVKNHTEQIVISAKTSVHMIIVSVILYTPWIHCDYWLKTMRWI